MKTELDTRLLVVSTLHERYHAPLGTQERAYMHSGNCHGG